MPLLLVKLWFVLQTRRLHHGQKMRAQALCLRRIRTRHHMIRIEMSPEENWRKPLMQRRCRQRKERTLYLVQRKNVNSLLCHRPTEALAEATALTYVGTRWRTRKRILVTGLQRVLEVSSLTQTRHPKGNVQDCESHSQTKNSLHDVQSCSQRL